MTAQSPGAYQLSLDFCEPFSLPDGERVYLTEAQAAWVLPLQRIHARSPKRDPACPGCALFGLCAHHDEVAQAVQSETI